MKYAIAVYWIAGCLLVGAAAGYHVKRCPNDTLGAEVAMLAAVAIWPATFGYLMYAPAPASECRVTP
jgi:hypothetical protein